MFHRTTGAVLSTAALGLAALLAPGAASAATPTTTTGVATAITTTTAVLQGHVDPHGVATDFAFDYGPTAAYGATTLSRSAGAGTAPRLVREAVSGLQPGTTYHFRILAESASGTIAGGDVTFTTTGAPPSQVFTGPAVDIGATVATPTGAIDPNGASTPWLVQYGPTTGYGLQTFAQPAIAPGFTAVPVSVGLPGLASGTLFHYRVVAFHGAYATYGADGTFFTRPAHAQPPAMTTRTTPSRDTRSPYEFTTSGALKGGTYIPASYRCSGTVGIRYYDGSRQLASAVAGVTSSCTFGAKVRFRHTGGRGAVALRVTIYHRSNGYLAGESVIDHVTAGR